MEKINKMELDKDKYWKKITLLESFFRHQLKLNREKIYKIIFKKVNFNNKEIIDIGSTPDLDDHHNPILHKLKNHDKLTSLSNLDCSILKKINHKLKVVQENGLQTSFKDKSFQIVHASATIEHVGNENNQIRLIQECLRLSREKVIITTPNRYFPIDFHTKIPLIHMLPKKIHRKILKITNNEFFSKEENLNLISEKTLIQFLEKLNINNYEIIKYKIFFMTSNLILIINKN